jgi:hypothetical protein
MGIAKIATSLSMLKTPLMTIFTLWLRQWPGAEKSQDFRIGIQAKILTKRFIK